MKHVYELVYTKKKEALRGCDCWNLHNRPQLHVASFVGHFSHVELAEHVLLLLCFEPFAMDTGGGWYDPHSAYVGAGGASAGEWQDTTEAAASVCCVCHLQATPAWNPKCSSCGNLCHYGEACSASLSGGRTVCLKCAIDVATVGLALPEHPHDGRASSFGGTVTDITAKDPRTTATRAETLSQPSSLPASTVCAAVQACVDRAGVSSGNDAHSGMHSDAVQRSHIQFHSYLRLSLSNSFSFVLIYTINYSK